MHALACVAAAGVGPCYVSLSVCSFFGSDNLLVCAFAFPLVVVLLQWPPKFVESDAPLRGQNVMPMDRRVRQRLDEVEVRIEEAEAMSRNHDQRISFQESPQRLVLRGFACVGEFFRARGGDFPLAKKPLSVPFFTNSRRIAGLKSRITLRKQRGCLLIGTAGVLSESILREDLSTMPQTGSFACNLDMWAIVLVTFCALLLFICKLRGSFFRIGSVGPMPRARAKVRTRVRRGARGRKGEGPWGPAKESCGTQQRERVRRFPGAIGYRFFRGLFFCLGLVILSRGLFSCLL